MALSALPALPGAAAGAGDPLPPLWQWLYFLPSPHRRSLGPDGHLREARHLLPVPNPRRMFACGHRTISEPPCLGEPAERVSSPGAAGP